MPCGAQSRLSRLIGRRHMFKYVAATTLFPGAATAADDWEQQLIETRKKHIAVIMGQKFLPDDHPDWKEVDVFLRGAPKNIGTGLTVTPYDVAEYLSSECPAKYKAAWPEPDSHTPTYANPLIVRFFLSTHTKPVGDETPWCAAFANWCLARAGVLGTTTASSQDFINTAWGQKVIWSHRDGGLPLDARRGDLAIFKLLSNPAHGHVTFFDSISETDANTINVLGGNELKSYAGTQRHLIEHDSLRTDGNLALWAILTVPGMRSKL